MPSVTLGTLRPGLAAITPAGPSSRKHHAILHLTPAWRPMPRLASWGHTDILTDGRFDLCSFLSQAEVICKDWS